MKRPAVQAGLVLGVLLLVLAIMGQIRVQSAEDDASESEIRQGFALAPVRLNLEGKNRALVGLGSYIVNAQGGCNDCHTCPSYAPGHNPFLGQSKQFNGANYLAGGVQFGPFTSRNITPELTNGLPEGLTLEQFMLVMHTGIDLDKVHPQISPLLQVMPWPVYGNMTDRDLRAVHEYLSAIPHAEPGTCSGPGE